MTAFSYDFQICMVLFVHWIEGNKANSPKNKIDYGADITFHLIENWKGDINLFLVLSE